MSLRSLVASDLGIGIGLRSVHYPHILAEWPKLDWFEILSENYMNTGGRPLQILDEVAARYPIAMHGVSMNIGSTDPLDRAYLQELKALQKRCGARWISDHLCWTGVQGENLHDLLPMPCTSEALAHLSRRVRQVQDILEQPLILENPSTYLEFAHADMDEPEFLAELCKATGCGLLLDVNNVYVSACNHGFDAAEYLARIPRDAVHELHLAGHVRRPCPGGEILIDSHSEPVCAEVWHLYANALRRFGAVPTLVEWDAELPPLHVLVGEARKADAMLAALERSPTFEVADALAA
jgi:hypothetical protein